MRLYYTTLSFPPAWLDECGSDPDMFGEFRNQYGVQGYDGLISGHAVLGHDAVFTMARAAKQALDARKPANDKSVRITPGEVWRELSQPTFSVNGASGVIVPAESQAADFERHADNRFVPLGHYISDAGPQTEHPHGVLSKSCSG